MKIRCTYVTLLVLFFLSGLVSLMYEITWARQLQNIFGSATFSISAILTGFFGGMAIGSRASAAWGRNRDPIGLYGIVEIALGMYALLFPIVLKFAQHGYLSIAASFSTMSWAGDAIKLAMAFLIFLTPCALMGATLPLLSRFAGRMVISKSASVGLLYGLNTLGAVAGTYISGFWMIAGIGLSATVRIAALINVLIGLCALVISRLGRTADSVAENPPADPIIKNNPEHAITWLYGISGFCALALEVFWTRAVMQAFTGTTYAFSSVLIVFLAGSAIGSVIASAYVKKMPNPASWFAVGQLIIGSLIFISLFIIPSEFSLYQTLVRSLPASWAGSSPSIIITSGIIVFIPAFFSGALFPLAVQWVSHGQADMGREVGALYSANTLGAILGSLCAGFVLIPILGLRNSLICVALLELSIGLFLLFKTTRTAAWMKPVIAVCFFAAAGAGIHFAPVNLFFANVPKDYVRLFHKEDAMADVSVYAGGLDDVPIKSIRVNNYEVIVETQGYGMCLLRREGHLPCILHPRPDSVLLIGLGSGISLSCAVSHGCKHVDCIEIVPAQIGALNCFAAENGNVASDPTVTITTGDGRGFMEATRNKYDVIIGDLFNVSTAGTGNLFAVDHFQACQRRLKTGGIMVQWLRPTQMFEDGFKTAIRSMAAVFPNVELWMGLTDPHKCVVGVVASNEPVRVDLLELQSRIDARNTASLASCGYEDAFFLVSQRLMDNAQTRVFAAGGACNSYDRPIIEFLVPKQVETKRNMEFLKSLFNNNPPLYGASDEQTRRLALWNEVSAWNFSAQIYIAAGRWTDAENILASLHRQLPRQPDTRFLLSQVECRLASEDLVRGNPASALSRLQMARQLGAHYPFMAELETRAKQEIDGRK